MSFCASVRNRLKMDAELFRPHFQQRDLVVQALHGYLSNHCSNGGCGSRAICKAADNADRSKDRHEIADHPKTRQALALQASYFHALTFTRKVALMRGHLFGWQIVDAKHATDSALACLCWLSAVCAERETLRPVPCKQ